MTGLMGGEGLMWWGRNQQDVICHVWPCNQQFGSCLFLLFLYVCMYVCVNVVVGWPARVAFYRDLI
jgi:hypothetical protein